MKQKIMLFLAVAAVFSSSVSAQTLSYDTSTPSKSPLGVAQGIVAECEVLANLKPGQTRTESPEFQTCYWCKIQGGEVVVRDGKIGCNIIPILQKDSTLAK